MLCMRMIGTTLRQGLTQTRNFLEDVSPHGILLDQNPFRAERSKDVLEGPPKGFAC